MVLLSELENSLFGLVLEAGESEKVEYKSERLVNITMAALDVKNKSDEFVPVVVSTSDSKSYIMCTLSKDKILQQPLQLMINAGENVTFHLNCENGKVNLTGYFMSEDHMSCADENCLEDHGLEEYRRDRVAKANEGEIDDSDEDEDDLDGSDDDVDDDDDDDDDDDVDDDDVDDDDEDDDEEEEEDDDDDEEEQTNGKRKLNGATEKKTKNQKIDDTKPPKLVPIESNKNGKDKKEDSTATKTLQGGVIVKEVKEGKGPEAKKGKFVHVYYTGKLKQNGKQFDACQSGKPFKFRLGSGEVIKGWDVGIENMKVGAKRQLVIPPNMAYGNKKIGNDIPANSTLIFDVELKAVS